MRRKAQKQKNIDERIANSIVDVLSSVLYFTIVIFNKKFKKQRRGRDGRFRSTVFVNSELFALLAGFAKKAIVIILILGLNSAGLSAIGSTVSFYNDTETSSGNSHIAGQLDFILDQSSWTLSSGELDLDPGESVSQDITVIDDDKSIDFKYIVWPEKTGGDDDFCNALELDASLEGGLQYSGPLFGFASATTTFATTTDEWMFDVSLPGDAPDFDNKSCGFDFVYSGWQIRFPNEGEGYHDIERVSNKIESYAEANTCDSSGLADFDSDANGGVILPGQIVDDEYDSFGLNIKAHNRNSSHPDIAIAFDSSNPTGGDTDLGSPNEDFGGPGIGSGGESGGPGENKIVQDNILIIAENDIDNNDDGLIDNPDDEARGGYLKFIFDKETYVESIRLIDIDESGVKIKLYDDDGVKLSTKVSNLGDNSAQTIDINTDGVKKMKVQLTHSGGVDNVCFKKIEPPPPPPVCPFEEGEGKTVINFDHYIRSDKNESDATNGPISAHIPAGEYDITLMSYDNHSEKPGQIQLEEQWHLILENENSDFIATTSAISDLPDDDNQIIEKVETDFVLGEDAFFATAFHDAYPDDNANSITPICALFEDLDAENDIVINEFLPNPLGADSASKPAGEWVELYNLSDTAIDVDGWYLYDSNDSHPLPISVANSDNDGNTGDAGETVVPSGGYLVVYLDGTYSSGWLNNDIDTVRLYNGPIGTGVLVDSYSYDGRDNSLLTPTPGDENADDSSGGSGNSIPEDKSYARIPDGVGAFVDPIPTPLAPNTLNDLPVGGNKEETSTEASVFIDIADQLVARKEEIDADTQAPVISIQGNNPAYLSIGATYSDLGATVTDNVNDNLGIKTFVDDVEVSGGFGNIALDTSTTTKYTIDYSATDQAGNTATSTRIVIVYDPIIGKPEEMVIEENAILEEQVIVENTKKDDESSEPIDDEDSPELVGLGPKEESAPAVTVSGGSSPKSADEPVEENVDIESKEEDVIPAETIVTEEDTNPAIEEEEVVDVESKDEDVIPSETVDAEEVSLEPVASHADIVSNTASNEIQEEKIVESEQYEPKEEAVIEEDTKAVVEEEAQSEITEEEEQEEIIKETVVEEVVPEDELPVIEMEAPEVVKIPVVSEDEEELLLVELETHEPKIKPEEEEMIVEEEKTVE